jgi:hypothetical protein
MITGSILASAHAGTRTASIEIYAVYDSSFLIALFDAKGLKRERERILYLDDVLERTRRPSFWSLKQYVMTENCPFVPLIGADYGFFDCREDEVLKLKEARKLPFSRHNVDPIKLHEAASSWTVREAEDEVQFPPAQPESWIMI